VQERLLLTARLALMSVVAYSALPLVFRRRRSAVVIKRANRK